MKWASLFLVLIQPLQRADTRQYNKSKLLTDQKGTKNPVENASVLLSTRYKNDTLSKPPPINTDFSVIRAGQH